MSSINSHNSNNSSAHLRANKLFNQLSTNYTNNHCHSNNNNTVDNKIYDVIVVGLGSHGSASLYHCAKNGLSCLGIEKYHIAHEYGSHHGESRIIRLAYWEHENYVPLLQRSYNLWNELEQESGEKLLTITGGLDIGPVNSIGVEGARNSCITHNIPYEYLNSFQIKQRFPAFAGLPDNYVAIYQADAGILDPQLCVKTYINLAKTKYNANIKQCTTVNKIEYQTINNEKDEIVVVYTNRGIFKSKKIILSNGAWLPDLINNSPQLLDDTNNSLRSKYFPSNNDNRLSTIASILEPERNVVAWYKPSDNGLFTIENGFPIWLLDYEGSQYYYGFPLFGSQYGVKLGNYGHKNEILTKQQLNNIGLRPKCDDSDMKLTSDLIYKLMPSTNNGECLKMSNCIFNNTPDHNFIIDLQPDPKHKQLLIINACSGHGFKFASALGELMADLVIYGKSSQGFDLDWLSSDRFTTGGNNSNQILTTASMQVRDNMQQQANVTSTDRYSSGKNK